MHRPLLGASVGHDIPITQAEVLWVLHDLWIVKAGDRAEWPGQLSFHLLALVHLLRSGLLSKVMLNAFVKLPKWRTAAPKRRVEGDLSSLIDTDTCGNCVS